MNCLADSEMSFIIRKAIKNFKPENDYELMLKSYLIVVMSDSSCDFVNFKCH